MYDAIPDGWHGCLLEGSSPPVFGQLSASSADHDGNPLHTFSYHGLPDTYRILISTQSGETWISDPYSRTVLQSSVTVDWAAKTATIPSTRTGYVLQFLSTFLPTLLIEGIVLLLFGYAWKQNWKPFLLVNLFTQGGLALYLAVTVLHYGTFSGKLAFLVAELLITLVESCLYLYLLKGHSEFRAFGYGVTANLCSALAGWFLMEPVWRFVVSIS
jgi:hypothetical protein